MTDLVKALAGNSVALVAVAIGVVLVAIAIVAIYFIAFFQGRSVSFWPPNIGPKPLPPQETAPKSADLTPNNSGSIFADGSPAIKVGTSIKTAGEKWVVADSASYTGGQATLIRAHFQDGEKVMLKLFWRGLNPSSTAWAAFSRESQASEDLRHRNVVQLLDRGLWNGYPFIVSEYLAGGTLHDFISSRDRISGSDVLSIAEQVAAGLDYAHTRGRVHRDLKPSNVLFERGAQDRVAISDFRDCQNTWRV